jgi:hypothetical protein
MLETIITSKTRIKLLLKFFLNSNNKDYLRHLEKDFDESTNAIRQELNRFEEAGMLTSELVGNKKLYRANTKHPLFKDIHSIIRKFTGVEQVVERVIDHLGNVQQVYLEGQLALGLESNIIDIIIVGDIIDRDYLSKLVEKAEPLINKRIRYLVLSTQDASVYIEKNGDKIVLVYQA